MEEENKDTRAFEIVCECGYKPLKHFEECPRCKSCSYHIVKYIYPEIKK